MKFNNKKKIIVLGSIIGVLIGTLISVSYAFFTFGKTSLNSQLVAGDIYMKYQESNSLNFTNAMPTTNYVENQYFEFQVAGKNTSSKDIIYDIVLNYGDNHATRTTRIRDELLRFRLVTVTNNVETEIFNDQSYSSINNKRIHATTIPKNTTSEITHTYRLYAWISNDTLIGNVAGADYSTSDWNDVFASVKVNVTGDFAEKEVARPINQVINTTTKDTGIKFYEISSSTNGEGLYMMESTENDTYPIYYYRGNVDNNNVYFAENCWKAVRTTSTGGLKLVYNGAATIVDGEKQCLETTGTGTQLSVGKKSFNSVLYSPVYVGYSLPATGSRYARSSNTLGNGIYYGSSVNQTTYKLEDPQTTLDSTHHYSYNSTDEHATGISGDTGNVRYYYYHKGAGKITGYFVKFDKTKSVSTILDEMLSESNSKNNPSTIQGVINTWWRSLDATYGEYLEDTEWCNDRSIGDLGGWNPDGGELNKYLYFTTRVRYAQSTFGSNANNIKNTNTPILTCSNPNDRLTVANGNLTYPIGLLTYDEVAMAGATLSSNVNSNFYLYTNQDYWLLSPSFFDNEYAEVGYVYSFGFLKSESVYSTYGVRPALSLKSGTQILRGEGTKTKPYVITED